MAKSVVVYTASWCPWCHKVVDFLKENKVKFKAKDVDEEGNAEECQKLTGQCGIPVTIVDGTVVVGCDLDKLKELLKLK